MLPGQLRVEQFNGYPPQARQFITGRINLLRRLPLSFLPLLLREVIVYDWKFPAEQKDLDHQLSYMSGLAPQQIQQLMARFAQLHLSPELEQMDWVNGPRQFSEQLTAHLWATHQMDSFRDAALDYEQKTDAARPSEPIPIPRLGIAVIGRGVGENNYPLFRKLRRWGVYFTQVRNDDGTRVLLDAVAARAKAHPVPFGHWYIDGGTNEAISSGGLVCVSYSSLDAARSAVVLRMRKAVELGTGPEALRTMLAETRPEDLGMSGTGDDAVLNRFQVSVLTEGSGTQLFSTTFVQWSAREALRRAQPVTLLVRFAPRQRERSMNELIAAGGKRPEFDPQGSLVDADMGAYYTWINQQRLSGAERSSFLVWFENHSEALAVGPSLPRGTESSSPITMPQLLKEII